jgi:hypothetical protein
MIGPQRRFVSRKTVAWCACWVMPAAATFGVDPVIHVTWDETPGPIEGLNYFVRTASPASPEFPDVELQTGSLTWRIWSVDTDNPNNIGDIGVISCPHADNFAVKILDDSDGKPKYVQQWPQVAIARNLLVILNRYHQEFGLTPASRSRIATLTKGDSQSDDFMRRYAKPPPDLSLRVIGAQPISRPTTAS